MAGPAATPETIPYRDDPFGTSIQEQFNQAIQDAYSKGQIGRAHV